METIKVRGLLRLSSRMFAAWGVLVAAKGGWDLLGPGEPEANLYAPTPWAFVTREQWARYAGFELVYGLCCVGLAYLLIRYSRFLPETLQRPRQEPEFSLFK